MSDVIELVGVGKTFRVPLDRSATLKYRMTHLRSSAKYRPHHALHDITFSVPEGQFLGVIGHNGSGKSTLLKILSRIYVPDAGSVRIEGRVSPFLELGVGFNPELTARDNVYLNGAVIGLTRRDIDQRVEHILDFAEVAEFSEVKLKNFSSGMQVRLAFSVAIQADAGILLMDEVLAVGDARFAEKCFDVFARYKRDGRTIVLVTHDLGSVQLYCDRVILLDHGRLHEDGSPSDVIATYRRMVGAQSDAAAAAADDDDEAISRDADVKRWGTREVSITKVRVLRADGTAHHTFTTDEPFVVEVDYEVHDASVGQLVVGLALSRSDGLNLSGPNTSVAGHPIACPPAGSTGRVRYTVDRLSLLGGAYLLSAAICDRHISHAFDHIENVTGFRVVDERGRFGIVDLGGRWDSSVEEVLPLQLGGTEPRRVAGRRR